MAKAEALCLVDHMFEKWQHHSSSAGTGLKRPAPKLCPKQAVLKETAYAAVSRKASKTSEKLSLTSNG